MAEEIELEITEGGGIRMLHNDAIDLSELGEMTVVRASHVEYSHGVEVVRGWFVQSAKTMKYLASGFKTRAGALAWEKDYYSPSGEGWAELTKEVY